ncbi:MAG: 50S ribosomal protein L11 [Candidatus Hodarchaeota archaeon]
MGEKVTCEALVEGGKASAGPPIGPKLGSTGANLLQIVKKINELTKEYTGLKVPVKITVDTETKGFEVEVMSPPTSALILKELPEAEKGSGNPKEEKIGDLDFSTIVSIAKTKQEQLLAKDLKRAVKTVLGTCLTLGVTVEGQDPRDIQKAIDQNEYDSQIL